MKKYSIDKETTKKIINIINNIPNGVYYEEKKDHPLVSLNIGVIDCDPDHVYLSFSIRSNRVEIENGLIKQIKLIEEKYNLKYQISQLSGYEHKEESMFINDCKELYIKCFNKKPNLIDMHICLEARLFWRKNSKFRFYCNSTKYLRCL